MAAAVKANPAAGAQGIVSGAADSREVTCARDPGLIGRIQVQLKYARAQVRGAVQQGQRGREGRWWLCQGPVRSDGHNMHGPFSTYRMHTLMKGGYFDETTRVIHSGMFVGKAPWSYECKTLLELFGEAWNAESFHQFTVDN